VLWPVQAFVPLGLVVLLLQLVAELFLAARDLRAAA
jgi:hypothetical protein